MIEINRLKTQCNNIQKMPQNIGPEKLHDGGRVLSVHRICAGRFVGYVERKSPEDLRFAYISTHL